MTPRKTARLLLVDDDPGLLKLLGMRLTSEGYQVDTAESGQQGLRVLAKERIDLVISDLRMEPSSGINPDSTHGTDTPADTEDKQ